MGKRFEVINGVEAEVNYTCCEKAKWEIEHLKSEQDKLNTLRNIINPPTYYGYMEIKMIDAKPKLELNYCPICGDKYKK